MAILATYGAASLEPAYSFLARLLSWVAKHMPESNAIHGTEYGAFLNSIPQLFRPDFFMFFFQSLIPGPTLPLISPYSPTSIFDFAFLGAKVLKFFGKIARCARQGDSQDR